MLGMIPKRRYSLLALFFTMMSDYSAANTVTTHQATILSAHNTYRALHHADALIWDKTLADYAERYAARCEFKHSASPYGENLAAGYPSIDAAVDTWYEENKYYSYQHPGFSYRTGHFTQLIWQASKKLGCAYVACDGKNGTPGNYLVCEYSPAGNVTNKNYFMQNVLPA